MPADVPTLLVKGLAEGLTLHAAERAPTDAEGLMDRFESLLGQRPHANQVRPVLGRLREEDLVREPGDGDGYRLTQQGARRLERYRRMPEAFGTAIVELFGIEDAAPEAGSAPGAAGEPPSPASEGWMGRALEALPGAVEVKAPHARVSLDRDPGSRAWTLRVENHDPGRYEGADACPLTFLYEAAARLVVAIRSPPPRPGADPGVSAGRPSPRD